MTDGGRLRCNKQYNRRKSFCGSCSCTCTCCWIDVSNLKGMASRFYTSVNASVMASNDMFIYTISGQQHLRLRKSRACGKASASWRSRAMLPVYFQASVVGCCSQWSCNFTFWVILQPRFDIRPAIASKDLRIVSEHDSIRFALQKLSADQ